MGGLLMGLCDELMSFNYRECFVGPFDVSNKVHSSGCSRVSCVKILQQIETDSSADVLPPTFLFTTCCGAVAGVCSTAAPAHTLHTRSHAHTCQVVEILMQRDGTDVCCTSDDDATRAARLEQQQGGGGSSA